MTGRLRFVARFLAVFALLLVAGWLTDAPKHYAALLRGSASIASPLANGWSLEARNPTATGRQELWFRRGSDQLRLAISLETLALGLLPLLALLAATPRLGLRRFLSRGALGCAGMFGLDLLVLLLYPLLVGASDPQHAHSVARATADIVGTFLGLLTFVGGPVILWFVLTLPQLRTTWRL